MFKAAAVIALLLLFTCAPAFAQAPAVKLSAINIDRVVAELEPEIKRTMEAGKIPSCAVALLATEQIVWQKA